MTRLPPIPLHPSVFSIALQQLAIGAQLTDIQATNRAMFEHCKYEHQPPHTDLAKSPYRWLLQKSDSRSLYRQFNRLRGLRISVAPHVNVHQWLDPSSRAYKPEIAEAVFHYSARAEKGDRFEVCLATPEMRESAWKYGHGSQIILDGTFGVCDRKVLLFIAMGVDEAGSGVPLAFFLFSAPSGNNNTSAGYNTDILEKLLRRWKDTLDAGQDRKQSGPAFAPKVAITDTDLKERNALVRVFPDIWLLICKFHLRQSWRNHRTRVTKGTSKLHTHVRSRLRELETKLVDSLDHGEALSAIANERAVVESDIQPQDPQLAAGALAHLTYLAEYWMAESLWRSWSAFGRRVAADKLGREVSMILTTTNHLESFNGVLKRKHLRRWQRGNRRLRIDVLLHLLITNILPSVFQARALERQENIRLTAMVQELPGGVELVKQLGIGKNGLRRVRQSCRTIPYAILTPDPSRDAGAADLVAERQISAPEYIEHTHSFEFDCFSSLATESDKVPTQYKIHIGVDGSAACSCPDFLRHGIACKHIRAALLRLEALHAKGYQIARITLPTTRDEARIRFQSRAPLVTGDLLPGSTSPTATDPALTVPFVVRHAAQLVDDILRESADAYKNPADRAFVPRHESGQPEDWETSGDETPAAPESDSDSDSNSDDEDSDDEGSQGHPGSMGLSLNARDGVGRQAVARVLHELDAMAPLLTQLLGYLDGASLHRDEVERARVAQVHLEALSAKLSQLLQQAGAVSTSTGPVIAVNPPPTSFPSLIAPPSSTAPRARTPPPSVPQKRAPSPISILPPSPEKSQRRQNSYSIH